MHGTAHLQRRLVGPSIVVIIVLVQDIRIRVSRAGRVVVVMRFIFEVVIVIRVIGCG